MTTVLITADMIGWDDALQMNGVLHKCPMDKVFVNEHGVWCFAGAPSAALRVIKAIVDGMPLADVPGLMETSHAEDGGFEVVRIWEGSDGKQHIRYWTEHDIFGLTPPLPLTLGSGGNIALGAYYACDKNVVKAMKIAAELDLNSSEPTQTDSTTGLYEQYVRLKKQRAAED